MEHFSVYLRQIVNYRSADIAIHVPEHPGALLVQSEMHGPQSGAVIQVVRGLNCLAADKPGGFV